MIPLILDFETWYEPGVYTLTGMPTQQYLRDRRFKCLGVSIAGPMLKPRWVTPDRIDDLFEAIPWDRVELIAHNARFDYTLLRQWWPRLPRPAKVFCTRDMGRYLVSQGILPPSQRVSLADMMPLVGMSKGNTLEAVRAGGGALRDYACNDAIATLELYLRYERHVPQMERDLIDMHARMQAEAVLDLDVPLLTELAETAPDPMACKLRSKPSFAAALRAFGVEPVTKSSKTGKQQYAFAKTDEFMQDLEDHPDARVQILHALRTQGTSNLVRTRAARILGIGAPFGVPLAYYGAHTGRASGTDRVNLQNLPARSPDSARLRSAIKAPPGHLLVIVDSAQIEVRVNAWRSGEQWLLDAMAAGDDPYIAYARQALGKRDISTAERRWAKVPVLAFGYGQGANGYVAYCQRSGIPMDESRAQRECRQWRDLHPAIVAQWAADLDAAATGAVMLPSGRKLTYPGVANAGGGGLEFTRPSIFSRSKTDSATKLWHGVAAENITQAIARDVVMWQTLEVTRRTGYQCVLSVHDEAVYCVPESEAERVKHTTEAVFAEAPSWAYGLPMKGETKVSAVYSK